ncbi:hypothetical protein NQ317_008151 [Molorchus minor]|uniref:Uncharacterized protein n=1 Tax=Molorchus minor TaxID=1323400 RepID=A0ABQ9JIF9_9CUCU|nr:hypothetical protein NQ317_008151 [Molorchus minor]
MSAIKFKMLKNNDQIKDITMDINLTDMCDYRSTLNTFKKSINTYLTQQVELEKVIGDNEIASDDSDSSEDERGFKRVLTSSDSIEKDTKIPKRSTKYVVALLTIITVMNYMTVSRVLGFSRYYKNSWEK